MSEQMMARIQNAGLLEKLNGILDEFLIEKSPEYESQLLTTIDQFGLKSEEIMKFVSLANRSTPPKIKPGIYRKLVEISIDLNKKESVMGSRDEDPVVTTPAPQGGNGSTAASSPAITPMPPPVVMEKPSVITKAVTNAPEEPSITISQETVNQILDKPTDSVDTEITEAAPEPVEVTKDPFTEPVPIEEIWTGDCQSNRVMKVLSTRPMTMQDLIAYGKEHKFTETRINTIIDTKTFYMADRGWCIAKVGRDGKQDLYQAMLISDAQKAGYYIVGSEKKRRKPRTTKTTTTISKPVQTKRTPKKAVDKTEVSVKPEPVVEQPVETPVVVEKPVEVAPVEPDPPVVEEVMVEEKHTEVEATEQVAYDGWIGTSQSVATILSWAEKPRTEKEMVELGKERGFTKEDVDSLLSMDPETLSNYGWYLTKAVKDNTPRQLLATNRIEQGSMTKLGEIFLSPELALNAMKKGDFGLPINEFHVDRVVVDREGQVVGWDRSPSYGVLHDEISVIYIRDDGWALAAPQRFADTAESMWPDQWRYVIKGYTDDIPIWESYSFFEYNCG